MAYSAGVRRRPRPGVWCRSLAGGLLLALAGSCYDGPGPLEPSPGSPGGLCIEPQGLCDQPFWTCDPVGRFCYDTNNPCRGVLCGGHGVCSVDDDSGLPECSCELGYNNFSYALLCEPL